MQTIGCIYLFSIHESCLVSDYPVYWFRFENLLFKLEVSDHKARERAGVITQTLGSPISVLLQIDAALEV